MQRNRTETSLGEEQHRLTSSESRLREMEGERQRFMEGCIAEVNRLRHSPIFEGEFREEADLTVDTCTAERLLEASEALVSLASQYKMASADVDFYRNKLEKMRNKVGGACPCCEQGMSAAVIERYLANIERIFNRSALQHAEADFDRLSDEALSVQSRVRELDRQSQRITSTERDITASKEKIGPLRTRLAELVADETVARATFTTVERRLEACEQLHGAWKELASRWTDHARRLKDAQDKKRRYQASINPSASSFTSDSGTGADLRGIDEIEALQMQRQSGKDREQAKKEQATDKIAQLGKTLALLERNAQDKENERQQWQRTCTQYEEAHAQIQQWKSQREVLEKEISAVQLQLKSERDRYTQLHADFKQKEQQYLDQTKSNEQKVAEYRSSVTSIKSLTDTIEDHQRRHAAMNVQQLDEEITTLTGVIPFKEAEIRKVNALLTQLNTELAQQDDIKRVVRDNLDYRQRQQEHQALLQEQDRLTNETSTTTTTTNSSNNNSGGKKPPSFTDLQRDLQRANTERSRLQSEKDKLGGTLETLQSQLDALNKKLEGPVYKGIKNKYKQKYIEYEATLLAVADLDSYFIAL